MSAAFSLPIRVYIEDTDAGGIVYYVNYLKYMERARTELMRRVGYGRRYVLESDVMFVVKNASIEYRRPATLDDELTATADVVGRGRAWLLFRQAIRRGDELLCDGHIKVVCVRKDTMKPVAMPAPIRATLEDVDAQITGGAT